MSMRQSQSPHDTGARLEPQLWPPNDDPDRYGRVDFDDDEGATVISIHVEPLPSGEYALCVTRVSDVPLAIDVDGELSPLIRVATANEEVN